MKNIYKLLISSRVNIIRIFLLSLLGLPFAVTAQESMRANLYVVDANGATLVDGNLTNYNNMYSNAVDINDAWKMSNPGINFGILRDGYNLVVERRSIINLLDTTTFRMWNMPHYNYQIKFILKDLDHPGLKAVLKDNFLNSEKLIGLNDTTNVDFAVNADPGSASQTRFQLIYKTISSPVSLSFTDIQAHRSGKNVMLQWTVINQVSIASYIIQSSADGRNFRDLGLQLPDNSLTCKTYTYTDNRASTGENYYRIKAINTTGEIKYSALAKIDALLTLQEINVYPNPIMNNTIQLQFNGLPEGKYSVTLLYNNGINQQLSSIQLSSSQTNYSVNLPQRLVSGIYQLLLTGPGNTRFTKIIEIL